MNITKVTSDNFDKIFENGRYLITEAIPLCNIHAFKKEWEKVLKEDKAVIFAIEENEKVIGIFMGVIDLNSCTCERTLTECHWYVLENHRHTAGVRLYQEVLEFAKKDYCKAVIYNANSENKSLINFLEKQGFKPVNIFYKKEL
jgi:ribosomal protein S18 acetylase RimI-like enzyme